jgi:hypothetical protein
MTNNKNVFNSSEGRKDILSEIEKVVEEGDAVR